jgi:hypothetical protein
VEAPGAQSWTFGASGVDTAAWNGTATLTVSLTAGGTIATFGGQAYTGLNAPLPGWPSGCPS